MPERSVTTNIPVESIDHEESLRVVIVDKSADALESARDTADARIDAELGEGGRVKRFLNGIWKGNVAKEYYRQKYASEELRSIEGANDTLIHEDASRRTRAIEATITRFSSDYEDLIHTDAGEKREVIDESSQLGRGVKHLVREFAEGRLNAATLQEERTRLLVEYRKEHGQDLLGKGVVSTDNLLDIAQRVVGVVEHGESLDSAIARLEVVVGEARDGARTEAQYSSVDKIIDKLSKHKIGSLVTPGTLAVGVAVAATVARVGSQSVLGAVTKTLIPGGAAAAWAGLRENKRTKDERAQYAREMAVGGAVEDGSVRREQMESTRYETLSANDLIATLKDSSSADRLSSGGGALEAALDALAAVRSRVELSDTKSIDLISYSSKDVVGEERMLLDIAMREARLSVEAELTDEARTALGLSPGEDLRDIIRQRSQIISEVIISGEGGVTEKDAVFAKLKAKRVAKAMAVGAATGVLGGLLIQEVVAGVDPTRLGLIDMIRGEEASLSADGLAHQTILAGMVEGSETTIHTDASTTYEATKFGEHGLVELSDDHTLTLDDESGLYSLIDGNGVATVAGIEIDGDGVISQESLDMMASEGLVVEDNSFEQEVSTAVSTEVTVGEYVQNHSEETTLVERDLWYGNDTPGVYDENELRVYRGGSPDAPGIIDGGYQYTVAGMHADGSWQGGESIDWNQAAASGNLFVAVSASVETQDRPFMIPIGPDGSVNISADSPAGQFFSNEGGEVSFNGAYMEIIQTTGQDPEGVTHIRPLATLVGGESVSSVVDTVVQTSTEYHPEYVITTNGFDTIQSNFTEMAPITPIASRRSLEALARERIEGPSYGYQSGEMGSAEREHFITQELSPRLRGNPDARLELAEELDWHHDEVLRLKGQDYIRGIEEFADNDPVLSAMSNETGAIVMMPVGAAYEAENIYGTLSLFAQQDKEGTKNSPILLNVNWLTSATEDPDMVSNIRKTLSEIERAKADFPDLSIAVMQRQYDDSVVNSTGGVVGYFAEDLINAALLATRLRVKDGSIDSDHDIVIVRSDSDVGGIAKGQLRNLKRAISENPDLDVVKGATRFGTEDGVRYPAFGIEASLMTSFQILNAHENIIHTGGANFGIRASTLAAIGGLGEMLEADRETGELKRRTGAGSDDVALGRRVSQARQGQSGGASSTSGYGYGAGAGLSTDGARRIKLVAGAAIDTNGDRMVATHLKGKLIHSTWNGDLEGGFSDGPGDYRDRKADKGLQEAKTGDISDFTKDAVYERLEAAMNLDLGWSSPRLQRKALAMLFGSVPGAYVLRYDADGGVEFKLTAAGRAFIRKRAERETNGQFGSWGAKKMRQVYGSVKPGAKRQPVSETPSLVSPKR